MNRLLRHIAPIVLLATYLPMAVLSSLHIHHETSDTSDHCQQCVGHFETQHHHQSDCQYCNFLSLSCLVQDSERPTAILPETENIITLAISPVVQLRHGVAQLRAPPTR